MIYPLSKPLQVTGKKHSPTFKQFYHEPNVQVINITSNVQNKINSFEIACESNHIASIYDLLDT